MIPGDALLDEALERRDVDQTADHVGARAQAPRQARHAERAQRHAEEIAEGELKDVVHAHVAPGVGELPGARPGREVRARRHVGRVDGTHRRPREHVELEARRKPRVDLLEEMRQHARLVGAARAAAREDEAYAPARGRSIRHVRELSLLPPGGHDRRSVDPDEQAPTGVPPSSRPPRRAFQVQLSPRCR